MNWCKENPFLGGLIAAAVVFSGVLSYLVFQAWTNYTLASETYAATVAKLHSLQNKVPFPSEENLKTARTAVDEYATAISALRKQLDNMEVPLDPSVSPQQFQDGLRAAVDEIRERAKANNVQLPENFYFGFDQYQTQVPSDTAAPYLSRQLTLIRSFVARLVDLKVQSIDSLRRESLPQEAPARPAPAAAASPNRNAPEEPVFEKFPIEISFTAEQSKFRVAFNSLLSNEQFILIRSLSLLNSSPDAPLRGGTVPAQVSSSSTNPFAALGTTDENTSNLQVILGRELVRATLQLEIFDFAEPTPPKD